LREPTLQYLSSYNLSQITSGLIIIITIFIAHHSIYADGLKQKLKKKIAGTATVRPQWLCG